MGQIVPIERPVANVEAEVAVIASMLIHPKVIDDLGDKLAPDHFAEQFLGFIYGTILREHSLGRPLNSITLRPLLEDDPRFAQMGGWPWLAEMANNACTIIGARDFAAQIIEFSRRRNLTDDLRLALAAVGNHERQLEEVIEEADDALCRARDAKDTAGEFSGAQCVKLVVDGFDRPLHGVRCSVIEPIDRLLGPLRPKHLIIGAGRPGMGKSATAISYALGAAAGGHGTLFVSLEMGAEEIGERMAADLCLDHRIPHDMIRDRRLNADQKRHVCRAMGALEQMPLQIVDRAGITINQLRVMVRRWQRRFSARDRKLELVIVDYLQLMRGVGKDRYEQISSISQGLKELAKEQGVAVFALAQLSRKVEERADKRPLLSDLKESGQIEQDADSVMFFLRDEYYLRLNEPAEDHASRAKWEDALKKCAGRIEFICAKRRHGGVGSLTGEFLYHYQAVRG